MVTLFRSLAFMATLFALAGAASEASAQGSFTNGGFETFTPSGSDRGIPTGTLSGWAIGFTSGSNYGYPGIITATNANAQFGYTNNGNNVTLANPSNGGSTTITVAQGTNMLAWENPSNACNCYLYQQITGLVQGATYSLTFSEAGAVWSGSNLATSDNWKVGWGTTAANSVASQTTSATVSTPIKGFSGWLGQQMTLVASASTMVLSFMANHPSNASQPPFALLDGVALTPTVQTPEPASAMLVISGMLGLMGLRRAVRRRG